MSALRFSQQRAYQIPHCQQQAIHLVNLGVQHCNRLTCPVTVVLNCRICRLGSRRSRSCCLHSSSRSPLHGGLPCTRTRNRGVRTSSTLPVVIVWNIKLHTFAGGSPRNLCLDGVHDFHGVRSFCRLELLPYLSLPFVSKSRQSIVEHKAKFLNSILNRDIMIQAVAVQSMLRPWPSRRGVSFIEAIKHDTDERLKSLVSLLTLSQSLVRQIQCVSHFLPSCFLLQIRQHLSAQQICSGCAGYEWLEHPENVVQGGGDQAKLRLILPCLRELRAR
mmetsp:Transcript_69974/g.186476  ORF Transcript_69974/g.186476 Transcript_69974/m.186476 type:complete len:275 (-) Transcript_69974:476-1300(-)